MLAACIKAAAAVAGGVREGGGGLARCWDGSGTALTRLASRGQSCSQFWKISQPIS